MGTFNDIGGAHHFVNFQLPMGQLQYSPFRLTFQGGKSGPLLQPLFGKVNHPVAYSLNGNAKIPNDNAPA